VITNQHLEQILDTSDEWIRSRTGIAERRQADEGVYSSDLGYEAACRALADARIPPDKIGLVICGTSTPDMLMPATACLIQDRIGARRAGAFDLLVACSGFAYGLAVGSQFVATGACDYVLVVGADVMTRIVDWEDRSTCVLFGDAAGAVVLGPVEEGQGILSIHLGADGSGAHLLKVPAGGLRQPGGTNGIPRRDFCLQMKGQEVFKFAVKVIGEAAVTVVEQAGLSPSDVNLFIPHQANHRIIEAATRRLGVSPDRVFVNLDRYGNTSCASVPLALSEARDAGRLAPGDVVVMVGFGGGLSWGAVAMRWVAPGPRPHLELRSEVSAP
jgi:3-oxoacyl-[acyl-carrier-protein] synthase-3